ncbi:MAG: ABC transporter ATP-binding protein [Planctomycetota bacterium]|nr:MAG: ABC transporter ATP-binding protein [Planctomycetota bacterium]
MSDAPPILRAQDLSRSYHDGARELTVLRGVSMQVQARERVAIIGPSGSGKSTLLGLLAGLDVPSSGWVEIDGQNLAQLSPSALAAFRGAHIGFVFQSFRLLPYATALENVSIPLELQGQRDVQTRSREALQRVGLDQRLHHRPAQLSGGEQQRVAIARALVAQPRLVFADEPTGNLDGAHAEHIRDMLFTAAAEHGAALIVVTHDPQLAECCDRVIRLDAGQLLDPGGGVSAGNVAQ